MELDGQPCYAIPALNPWLPVGLTALPGEPAPLGAPGSACAGGLGLCAGPARTKQPRRLSAESAFLAPRLRRRRRLQPSVGGEAAHCFSPRPRCRAAPTRSVGEPPVPHVSWVMKLNPQQAPLYGDCVVTVLLAEEDKVEDDVVFYLVFLGSTLHHCTSTRKVSSDTLETITPGHDCCETVKVLLCASKEGLPVFVVAEEDFEFVQDEACDAAQFLATSAGNQQALNFTRFLDRSGPPSADVNSLDEKVALAFRHLKLPAEWNVLGTNQTLRDGGPRETLMHFAVRLGLLRLTWFLLQKPGGRGALSIHNQEGATPASLALQRGYHKLHKLLTEENAGEPDSWSSLSYEIPCGDCSVRHHRELDVYTLTSEPQAHHEPPLPADSCTGHIFKLMNIQQQLMKTNLKQMDNLMPLMVTAQDPSGVLTAQDADGSFLPCASGSTDSPPPSSPPAGAGSSPRGSGITAAQVERPSDFSSAGKEENTDCSCRKKNKGVERKEEEAEPTVDSETRSNPQSCLQSMSDCGEKGKEGLPPCEIGSEETQAKSATAATAQGSLSSGGAALPGVTLMESGPAPHFPAGEQEGRSTGDAGVPETAEGAECGLRSPDAATQKKVLSAGERTKARLETSHVGAAGASHVKDTRQPVDTAMVPNCVSATSSLDGETPAESVLVLSHGGAPIEKTAETETSRRCDASADDQSPASVPAAADGKMDAPLAHTGGAVSSADLPFPRPQKDALPKEKAETNSPHLQSQNDQPPICSPPGDDQPPAASASGQSTVTSSGALAAEHRDDTVTQPGGSATGPPHAQPPPTAVCPEGPQAETVTPDPVGDTQEDVGFCPLEVLDAEGQTRGVNSQTPLSHALEVELHPHAVFPKAEREPVPAQAVTSGRTFSPAGRPGSESVTKDDALSLVPSQNEKGTATPQPLTATDRRDGGDWSDPDKQPLEDRAAGLPTPPAALDPQPSMGNASPGGFGGEQEDPCLPAAPEVRNMEGGTGSSRLHVAEAPLASDSSLTEEGNSPVVPESSAAQGQGDRFKAVICSSTKEDTLPSGALREEQGTDPPRQESPGDQGEPGAAACARDKALEHGGSRGTPSACLSAETKHNKEVAPPASLLTEGGAAQSPVSPGAGLATDAGQEAVGAEQSSSPRLPGLSPDASRASNCNGPSAVDGVTDAQAQGETAACEASGNMALDVAVGHALQGTAEARGTALSHSAQDLPVPEVLLRQENGIQVLPGALPDKGGTDLQGAAAPETVPPVWEKGKPEGAHLSCSRDASEEAQMNDTHSVPLQPTAKELPAEAGLSTSDDKAPSRDRGAPPAPHAVSAEAGHLPESADSIEEAASRIVDAVIEHVRASGALLTEGDISHLPPSSLAEAGPGAGQLESASAGKVHALLPGETPPAGSTREETPGSPAGCSAGREEPEKIIPPVPGPEPATEMPDTKADDEVDFLRNPRQSSVSEEAAGGDTAAPSGTRQGLKTQTINRESWCTIEPCADAASLLAPPQSPECENFLGVGLGPECAPTEGELKRESGSDSDLFHSPSEDVDSIVFSKPEEEQSVCDITGSSSSTDDTASLDRHSSHGSDVSLPQMPALHRSREQQSLDGFYSPGVGAEGRESESEPAGSGEMEEEEMDSITEVPANCSVLRSSLRSLSPFRRHSWGPGKNAASDGEMSHRSMSWCPSGVQCSAALSADFNYRSFSLEGLAGGAGVGNTPSSSLEGNSANAKELRHPFGGEERGDSLVSLSEEDLESGQREHRMFGHQTCHRSKQQGFNYCTSAVSSTLTKSVSLMTISHPGFDSSRSFHNTSANLTESITEENYSFLPQSPSKKDFEGKSGTKVSRTFSYIKNKMSSSKKSKEKEKEKEKLKEKEKDSKEKEKDKKLLNGHAFSAIPAVGPVSCSQCAKPFAGKDAYACANCSAFVHKGCRESLASCAKVKMKQPKGSLQAHDTSSLPTVIMRSKPSQPKERPRSAVLLADEATAAPLFPNRRSQQSMSLSKSVSIQNIAGVGNDENISNTWKFLSHSTDSLNKIVKVNESTESLTDEGVGTDMNEGQLMGDFESESKQLEAESWSRVVDSRFLKQQKKDAVKRQEVIYELMQTELHHIRTLKIMSDVYSRGMMTELLFEQQMVEKLFPCLDELISIHSQFFQRILERKKESLVDKSERNFLIRRMGDVLVNQFSGENAERLKKTYGKFCGQHNQSVNYFKDLYTKDKRFQAFVKKKMSSAVVRRLGIPECILLVTQRITKYPVLFQRILQCTKDNEVEQQDLAQSLSLVKEVIGAVDSKVASYEKKVRLNEIYTKTDSKSIMRMKSGQMFAKEDLKRKKLVRDGSVFLKNAAGRLKEVQAVLLTDILVFLQEKDQKYVFASLDQKSTVISLKKLIVREVAHEEKGLFLISMGMKDPEMVEVHASSKEERNSWIQIIQDTINTLNRDEDEGIPSENEEEKKMLDTKARELKEQLQQKDQQILLLLEEKEGIFRDMMECSTPLPEEYSPTLSPRILFRSNTEEALKGGPLMKSAINEVEILQGLVSGSLGGPLGQAVSSPVGQEGTVGPVSLPRRAETFGGFDSHQMNASKGGDKEEGDDGQDLRRTESDSGLKKGGNANLAFMLKRNNEQVIQSIVHLHELLSTLQGVVLQQDSYIEDQKLLLSERALARSSSRPSSLVEQEKQRSLERQRQDLADLQRQQAQHLEERRRREREWEARERALQEREARLAQREEEVQRGQQDLERDREALLQKRGAYQYDLERLRTAQKQLEREQEQLKRDAERLGQRQLERDACQVSHPHAKLLRIPTFLPNPEESPVPPAPSIAKSGSLDSELSVSPKRNSIARTHKDKGPFHILSSASQPSRGPEGPSQTPAPPSSSTRLFGLAKPKDKKEKKKKNKGRSPSGDGPASEVPAEGEEIFC
ncbi:A-kinase anchor protein 13 isoform X8 [Myotis daubentonii]|uniref:A-kinase anchor protein 13 isoform X8 n=1 Tax=Myotis daubentonii TaxID=98922 RepID=UPI002872E24D|nr:A-kinase anchor protein 13 isoform X8 [Myotis daubentonii]